MRASVTDEAEMECKIVFQEVKGKHNCRGCMFLPTNCLGKERTLSGVGCYSMPCKSYMRKDGKNGIWVFDKKRKLLSDTVCDPVTHEFVHYKELER